MLEKRWNESITIEEDYVDEWNYVLLKSCCFISRLTNLLSDVLFYIKKFEVCWIFIM